MFAAFCCWSLVRRLIPLRPAAAAIALSVNPLGIEVLNYFVLTGCLLYACLVAEAVGNTRCESALFLITELIFFDVDVPTRPEKSFWGMGNLLSAFAGLVPTCILVGIEDEYSNCDGSVKVQKGKGSECSLPLPCSGSRSSCRTYLSSREQDPIFALI